MDQLSWGVTRITEWGLFDCSSFGYIYILIIGRSEGTFYDKKNGIRLGIWLVSNLCNDTGRNLGSYLGEIEKWLGSNIITNDGI